MTAIILDCRTAGSQVQIVPRDGRYGALRCADANTASRVPKAFIDSSNFDLAAPQVAFYAHCRHLPSSKETIHASHHPTAPHA